MALLAKSRAYGVGVYCPPCLGVLSEGACYELLDEWSVFWSQEFPYFRDYIWFSFFHPFQGSLLGQFFLSDGQDLSSGIVIQYRCRPFSEQIHCRICDVFDCIFEKLREISSTLF